MERGIILNNCFDCIWRRNNECHEYHHLDENGNPEPVYDWPTDCIYFAEK